MTENGIEIKYLKEVVETDIIEKIIKIVKGGGGRVDESPYQINLFGVRYKATNDTFNDTLYIYWKESVNDPQFKCVKTNGDNGYGFTTKPGKYWVLNNDYKGVANGVAILVEGWHENIWKKGNHKNKKDHPALVQAKIDIRIARDCTQYPEDAKKHTTANKEIKQLYGTNRISDDEYELNILEKTIKKQTRNIGINLHRARRDYRVKNVGEFSAGCQVFQDFDEFDELLKLADKAEEEFKNKKENKNKTKYFSYYLTNQDVFESFDASTSSASSSNVGVGNSYEQSGDKKNEPVTQKDTNPNTTIPTDTVTNLGVQTSNEQQQTEQSGGSAANPYGQSETKLFNLIFNGELFPNDDNNNYIEMSSEDIAVIQYTEPNIHIDDIDNKIPKSYYATTGINPKKISYNTPVVFINDFMIPQTNITNFCLDYSSFLPQVMVEFVDMKNDMLSTNIPKPGSYIKVHIGGYGDEKYYKPIRQDFVMTNINKTNKTGGEYQNYRNSSNPIKYKFTGILNVPLGLRKMSYCAGQNISARQAVFNVSCITGLGFATNFYIENKFDTMKNSSWVNGQNKSYFDFIKDITHHSCYSPYTFFTSFIDQYYVLNYVECRRLLSHGGKKEDSNQIIYNCILPEIDDKKDNGEKKDNTTDEILNNGEQRKDYYCLTNDDEYKGWTNYIEEYYEINEGYTIMTDGYCKFLSYDDGNANRIVNSFQELVGVNTNFKFKITPIDNLKRNNDKNISKLPDNPSIDTYIPLNLRQTTNPDYIDDNIGLYNNPASASSIINLDKVDTANTFPLYYYAPVQNDFQMKYLKKCGLSVRLQNYNPSITRYSRIWVDIYDMNQSSLTQITKNETIDRMVEELQENSNERTYLESVRDNLIFFDEEHKNDNVYKVYNRSLSGWYVVTDMKISYNTVKDFKGKTYKKLQTQLILNRIEYKPTFKNEYNMSKEAVVKYSTDNLAEDLLKFETI